VATLAKGCDPSQRPRLSVHLDRIGHRCREHGVRPSTGSVGDCFDNAMAESFFATLECKLLDRRRFRNPTEARLEVFRFIEG